MGSGGSTLSHGHESWLEGGTETDKLAFESYTRETEKAPVKWMHVLEGVFLDVVPGVAVSRRCGSLGQDLDILPHLAPTSVESKSRQGRSREINVYVSGTWMN